MYLNQRITAFSKLGSFLNGILSFEENPTNSIDFDPQWFVDFSEVLIRAHQHNAWFTPDQVKLAIKGWASNLNEENLNAWMRAYPANNEPSKTKTVAVVMAGNLPLVGFHDFLSILITGHKLVGKLSSNDRFLLPFLAKVLIDLEPEFKDKIQFTEEKLPAFDAVIATGSNNTARYFEYYFKEKPHIIRKNRNAVAVISGNETSEELQGLASDIFSFFGMGCRSVSKIFFPADYDFDIFFNSVFEFKDIVNHNKYANNYDYNKAVYLMGLEPMLDNNFMVLKEDENFSSPIAVVFYEKYTNTAELKRYLQEKDQQIQCIVAHDFVEGEIAFGQAQRPQLWDYADGVDTIAFLLKI